jgi:DNA primase
MVRFSDRDGERRIRARSPDPNDPDRWRWDVTGVRRVLYRLPQVLEAERVIVTEGEKDADTVCEFFGECPHSIVGTTNPFGAGKWEPAFSESLRGKDVVILPDNDQTGQVHADSVRSQLEGIAASVRVVNIPSEPGVKDVSDFLREHSGGELVDLIGLEWLGYMPA